MSRIMNLNNEIEYWNQESTYSIRNDESLKKGISENELNMPIKLNYGIEPWFNYNKEL